MRYHQRVKLIVLGSGTSVPNPKRTSSAYWVETEHGSLLLDCSSAAIHRMAQEGCAWHQLDAIWISHFHLDHCGGIAPLLFGMKHAVETEGRTKPLRIYGPPGTSDLIRGFDSADNYRLLEQKFPAGVIEVEPKGIFEPLPGLVAKTFSTPHKPESCAIRLEEATGGTLVFTSDTGYSTNLAWFAREADVLLIESSFVENKPVKTHLAVDDVVNIVRLSKAKHVLLTHLYPEWDGADHQARLDKFAGICEASICFDGMRVSIARAGIETG